MPVQFIGNSSVVGEIEANSRAMRATLRGTDPGSLGAYSLSMTSGIMAAGLGAGSEVFHFRWTDATRICKIETVSICAGGIAAFAAGFVKFDMIAARGFTANGTGGNTGTTTGNNNKRRTSFGTSLVTSAASIRCASTAALTAGTKTLDAQALASVGGSVTATAGVSMLGEGKSLLWGGAPGEMYPVVFAQDEGFAIRATVPITGTWTFAVDVHWTELTSY